MPIVDCVSDRGQFFLPMSLNGSAPHYFIFDSGAGISAVDQALATELHLPIIANPELAGTAGVMTVNQVRITRIAPLRRGRIVDDLSWYGLTPTPQDPSALHGPASGAGGGGPLDRDR